ncbi:MAG: oligosaccharide flippase family protein [Gammaproteobacteria bacterium]|nr:oligosaccharide flippase family protein [Gammaproteobacteria bacterium]
MSSAARAIHGVQWSYAAMLVQMLAQLAFVAVVSRLLDPADFGVMAIAMVIVRFCGQLSSAGIRSYLIQKEVLTDADIQASFALTATAGAVLCCAAVLLAPAAAGWFDAPSVAPVIRALAAMLLLQGLSIPAIALLQRAFRFGAVAIIETAGYVAGYLLVGMLLALNGFGVWSLVGAALSQQLVVLLLSLRASRLAVGLGFGMPELTEAVSRGGHFAVNTILDYCVLAAPTVIVGRQFGSADLGIYNRSSTLVNLPTYAVSAAVSKVVLPYIAPMQSDRPRLVRACRRSATLSALIFLPVCIGMIPAAPDIVQFVLGDRWLDAIPVVQVLLAAMAMHLTAVQLGACADALRKLTTRTTVALATLVCTATAMYLLLDQGLVGAAGGVAAGQAVCLGLYLWLAGRWLGLSARDWISTYAPGMAVGALAAAATAAAAELLGTAPSGIALIAEIAAGAAAFAVGVLLYPQHAFKQTLGTLIDHFAFMRRMPLLGSALRLSGL